MALANTTVGFVGLGNMGGHMAANLVRAGARVRAFDVSSAALDRLRAVGEQASGGSVHVASSPAEAARDATSVLTMLPGPALVRAVYTDANGVLADDGAAPGTLLVDSSTIDPATARAVGASAAERAMSFVDAPVSGGVTGAEAATLTFMCGATSDDEFARARELLVHMGRNIQHCGAVGNGQVVKICNNLALAIQMVSIAEAMNLGVSLGADPRLLASIFNTSSARCWSSDAYNPVPGVMDGVPASRDYAGGFGVDLMRKDLGLAIGAAHDARAPAPLGAQALQLYNIISAQGDGARDFGVVYEFLSKKM